MNAIISKVVLTGVIVALSGLNIVFALPQGQQAEIANRSHGDINRAKYALAEKSLKKEKAVKIPEKFEEELVFSIKGLASLSKSGPMDDEGLKTLALLKMRGLFAYRYSEMKWCRASGQKPEVMDKAMLALIDSCKNHALWNTARMCYNELTKEAKRKTDVIIHVISAMGRRGDIQKTSGLLGELFDNEPLDPSTHYGLYLFLDNLTEAVLIDDKVEFDAIAAAYICKERSKILQLGWWRYFDRFLDERRQNLPASMKRTASDKSNCLEVEKVLLEEEVLNDDCLPVGSCVLIQCQSPEDGITVATITCRHHGLPISIEAIPDMFLLKNKVSDKIISEALVNGFKGKSIARLNDKTSGKGNPDSYTGALVWSLTHKPHVSKEVLEACTKLLESDLHTGFKCLVLKALIPALARTDATSDRLVDWLKKTVSLNKYKMMEAYAAMNLIVLYGDDYLKLKDVTFSPKVDEGFKKFDYIFIFWLGKIESAPWGNIGPNMLREIREAATQK